LSNIVISRVIDSFEIHQSMQANKKRRPSSREDCPRGLGRRCLADAIASAVPAAHQMCDQTESRNEAGAGSGMKRRNGKLGNALN